MCRFFYGWLYRKSSSTGRLVTDLVQCPLILPQKLFGRFPFAEKTIHVESTDHSFDSRRYTNTSARHMRISFLLLDTM